MVGVGARQSTRLRSGSGEALVLDFGQGLRDLSADVNFLVSGLGGKAEADRCSLTERTICSDKPLPLSLKRKKRAHLYSMIGALITGGTGYTTAR